MSVQGYREIKVSLDSQPVVHDFGMIAHMDADETVYKAILTSKGEPVDCTGAACVCRIIFHPGSASAETFTWNATGKSDGVEFTLPKDAHGRAGAFYIRVTVSDLNSHVNTVLYGTGFVENKELGVVYIPKDTISLDEVASAAARANDAATRASNAATSANQVISRTETALSGVETAVNNANTAAQSARTAASTANMAADRADTAAGNVTTMLSSAQTELRNAIEAAQKDIDDAVSDADTAVRTKISELDNAWDLLSGSMTDAVGEAVEEAYQAASAANDAADAANQAAEDAQTAVLENLEVSAETLPEGSEATADYVGGVLYLGIPKGDTGHASATIDDTKTETSTSWSSKKTSDEISSAVNDISESLEESISTAVSGVEQSIPTEVKKLINDELTSGANNTWSVGKISNEIHGMVNDEAKSNLRTWSSNKISSELSEKVVAIKDQYGNVYSKENGEVVVPTGGSGSSSIAALRVGLDVVPGTTGYSVTGVTSGMVVAESDIPSGVQGSDWTITTTEGRISIGGTISKSGKVYLTLVENGSEFVDGLDARFTALENAKVVEQLVTGGTDGAGDMNLGLSIDEYVVLNVLGLRDIPGYYTSFFTPIPTATTVGKWAAKMIDDKNCLPIANTLFAVKVYYIRK